MPGRPAIRLEPVTAGNRAALLALDVSAAQRRQVGAIADLLADAQACAGCLPLAIYEAAQAVGFVRIEAQARVVVGALAGTGDLGLRAFFIDARHQGRKLGTRALDAVLAHLRLHYPAAAGVALSVDRHNAPALALYRRAGFVPLRHGYHGAPDTALQPMWCALSEPRPPCTITSATSSN